MAQQQQQQHPHQQQEPEPAAIVWGFLPENEPIPEVPLLEPNNLGEPKRRASCATLRPKQREMILSYVSMAKGFINQDDEDPSVDIDVYDYVKEKVKKNAAKYGFSGCPTQKSVRSIWQTHLQPDNCVIKKATGGRPTLSIDDKLRQLVTENPRLNSRELARMLDCSHPTVLNHLKKNLKCHYYKTSQPDRDSGWQDRRRKAPRPRASAPNPSGEMSANDSREE